MIVTFSIAAYILRLIHFYGFCLTHILTHNRKNGGGDNGHKTAGRNRNPS